MAEKTGFILYYDMLQNIKILGNDVAMEILTALANYDQGKELGELSPQAQFAVNAYIPTLKKAKRRWETSAKNGSHHTSDNLPEPDNNLPEPDNNLPEPSDNLPEPDNNLPEKMNGVTVTATANDTVPENDNANFENKDNPQSLFLYYWQHNPDIFDFQARVESWKDWEKFWKQSHFTCSQIKAAMDNFILDVREGIIERKYIPLLPDRFVLKGWLTKCQERLKPQKPPQKDDGMKDLREVVI